MDIKMYPDLSFIEAAYLMTESANGLVQRISLTAVKHKSDTCLAFLLFNNNKQFDFISVSISHAPALA